MTNERTDNAKSRVAFATENETVKVQFEIEAVTMNELSDGEDNFYPNNDITKEALNINDGPIKKNVTPNQYEFVLNRITTRNIMKDTDMDKMPGFRITWNYFNHIEPSEFKQFDSTKFLTVEFVRYE